MKNIKTFQGAEERLNGNAGAGLNKVVCVVIVLILIVLVCVGGFFWYKHSKNEAGITGNLSINELVKMGLQVGDYVSYTADIDMYIDWRVWKIEGDNVIIVPTIPQGNLKLEGPEDWINAEEKIEKECDKYINSSLGITAEEIRSMKIEDIEEVMPAEDIESAKLNDDYGKEYICKSGIFYAKKAYVGTFDGYNKELSTPKTATSNSPVKLKSTSWRKGPTWNKLNNTKTGMMNDTYGTILGNTYSWLASRCVGFDFDSTHFNVRYVCSDFVGLYNLCDSDGGTDSNNDGVRPLVFLSSKLFNGEGEGTSDTPWHLAEKIESGENGKMNEITDEDSMELQVGDYVSYISDIGTSAHWRVWKIEGDNVIIVPTKPLGDLALKGAEDWLNAEEKIEDECDKYVNSSLGITAEEIRSMKIEDIKEVLPDEEIKEEIKSEKEILDYGTEHSYRSGTFYAEKADVDTFDGYNKELSTPKTASSSSPVKLVSTSWSGVSLTWNKLKNTKTGMKGNTYGTILGDQEGWLASRCVFCTSGLANFHVFIVDDGYVHSVYLCTSGGYADSNSYGVRPLVTLSSKLFTGEGEGTKSNPWQLNG